MSYNRYEPPKTDIVNDPDKGVGKAQNVLARLFRLILRQQGIDLPRWNRLMQRYLADPRNKIPPNGKDKSSARGNLNKELRRPTMTWRVWNDKAIPFLNPVHVRFKVELTWANGRTSVHEVNMSREQLLAELNLDDDVDNDNDE